MDPLPLQRAWKWGCWLSAKEGTTKEQVDSSSSYAEVKTILKAKQHTASGGSSTHNTTRLTPTTF